MKKANIIVLAGQSNAVGVGHVKCLPKHFSEEKIAKWRNGYENVKINYFSHDKKSGGFVKTTVNCAETTKDTFGPELGIADALDEKYPGREFFIVKCAFGGMSMWHDYLSPSGGEDYDPLSYADQYEHIVAAIESGKKARAGWCYNELVKLLTESISYLEENGYTPVIKAFCWMQGENDACTDETTESYARHYDAMLRDFKAEFVKYLDKCLFIDAGISTVWERFERLDQIKRDYAKYRPDCVYIDTIAAGLTTENEPPEAPDLYHYDSDCVIKLGHLFADGITNI